MVNTDNLNDAIRNAGYFKWHLASVLGMSRQNLSNKINNKTSFAASEMKQLKKVLKLSDDRFVEIFFADDYSAKE